MNDLPDDAVKDLRSRRRRNLRRLLNARSIAFVGGAAAASGIRYCRMLGFQGDIWAVNSRRGSLNGVPCVARVADLPSVPDTAWIAIPAQPTINVVRELNAIGTPSAVCYAAGFSETGDRELERQLIVAAGDMAILGPNCIGAVNFLDGIPVVLKAHGKGFAHKTELDAVVLNLADDRAVRESATRLLALPGADGVEIEEMVTDAVAEVIVGISRHATLGLGLTIGTGGIFTEILNDSVTLLLPATREDVNDALRRLRGWVFLDGYRGRPPGDIEALSEMIDAITSYAESHADVLLELDVNPILVRPKGCGAVAVDALIRLGESTL